MRTTTVFLLLLLCNSIIRAADVTGKWVGSLKTSAGQTVPWYLDLKQDGDKLTGRMGPEDDHDRRDIQEGRIDGVVVRFKVPGGDGSGTEFVTVELRFESDELTGTMQGKDARGQAQTYSVSFKRPASAVPDEAPQRTALRAYRGAAGVLEAFSHSEIVALPDRHQDDNSSRFRIDLISGHAFGVAVTDIVIEWGNRLYQETLDRYIAGAEVSDTELQRLWRNTTVLNGTWDSPVYAQFLRAVRSANRQLPREHHLRVLAADPPIDWDAVHTRADYERFATHRDESVLAVLEANVLPQHHKALLIMGGGHFLRGVETDGRPGVVDLYERAHPPERIFVIAVTPSLNQQLSSYPASSFFFTAGSWLEAVSSARGQVVYDGVLTIPPGETVHPSNSTYADAYPRELERRRRIVGS